MKKLFIILAVMAVMFTLLAVSVSAEVVQIDTNYIESIVASEGNGRVQYLSQLFDGSIATGGIYDHNTGWCGNVGEYFTITFKDEIVIELVDVYLTGNYTKATIDFFNANGDRVYTANTLAESGAYGPDAIKVPVFEESEKVPAISVKTITLKVTEIKWNDSRTYKIHEIVIKSDHEHSYKNEIERLENPTCALPGSAIFECVCGLTQESIIPATGEHTEPIEQIVFRDGLTGNGYKAMVCGTCDTQDVRVEGSPEIGPLFESLGYSICTFGDYGIQLGIGVNYENLALYEEVSGKTVEFGTVVTSRNILTEGNPLITDGATGEMMPVDERILVTNLTERNYSVIVSKLSGFGESFLDTELILSVYVRLGNSLFYLGDETTKSVVTKTYNSLAETLN